MTGQSLFVGRAYKLVKCRSSSAIPAVWTTTVRATRTHALKIIEGICYWLRGGGLADRLLRRITYRTAMLRQLLRAKDAEPLFEDVLISAVLAKHEQRTVNLPAQGAVQVH